MNRQVFPHRITCLFEKKKSQTFFCCIALRQELHNFVESETTRLDGLREFLFFGWRNIFYLRLVLWFYV